MRKMAEKVASLAMKTTMKITAIKAVANMAATNMNTAWQTTGKKLLAAGVLTVMASVTAGSLTAFASPVIEAGKKAETVVEVGSKPGTVSEVGSKPETVSETGSTPGMVSGTGSTSGTVSEASNLVDIGKLEGANQTDQYVVVLGNGMDSEQVTVGYYKKNAEGAWSEQFRTSGFCGLNGMAADKREGDKRTPTGVYQFVNAFGILANPGSVLPYKQVDEYDFWVDDGKSRYYNQMVSTREVAADWTSAEPLVAVDPAYNYALALNYNTDARTPGRGSAIFLHGLDPRKDWTSGCIAIPEDKVKLLVQEVDADTRIVILPEKPAAELE